MPRIVGMTADCPRCNMPVFVPIELCTPAGVVRCGNCPQIVKRDVRPWWQRVLHA